jgi:sulfonate transport system permease protein
MTIMATPTSAAASPDPMAQRKKQPGLFSRKGVTPLAGLLSVLSIWGAWELAGLLGGRLPSLGATLARLGSEWENNEIWVNFAVSMNRFALGLVLALIVGAALGLAIGLSRFAEAALSDLNMVGLAAPAIIWALLTTMWFGFGWLTPVVTVFLSGLPFVVVNIAKAVRAVPSDLMLMARAFKVPRTRVLAQIVAPAVAGSTIAAVRFAVISAWNGLLLAEWFGSTSGVGWRARYWYDANQLDGFLAWVVLFMGFLMLVDQVVLGPIDHRTTRWRRA